MLAQKIELAGSFYAFGYHLDAQIVGQIDNCRGNGGIVLAFGYLGDE